MPTNKPVIKVLSVCGKTSDMCSIRAKDQEGNILIEHSGYVPAFFPGQHYGDYLELDIDVATGQILNWPKQLSQKTLRSALGAGKDDDE